MGVAPALVAWWLDIVAGVVSIWQRIKGKKEQQP